MKSEEGIFRVLEMLFLRICYEERWGSTWEEMCYPKFPYSSLFFS